MVAAMPFIRDESHAKVYTDHWNQAKPSTRGKWLTEAGYSASNYKHRTWAFVPSNIRTDVVTIIKRLNPQIAKPQSKPNTQYWWQEKEVQHV